MVVPPWDMCSEGFVNLFCTLPLPPNKVYISPYYSPIINTPGESPIINTLVGHKFSVNQQDRPIYLRCTIKEKQLLDSYSLNQRYLNQKPQNE